MKTVTIPVDSLTQRRLTSAALRAYIHLLAAKRPLRASELARGAELSQPAARAALVALEGEGMAACRVVEAQQTRQALKLWLAIEVPA